MSGVEDEIVSISFENAEFEKHLEQTLASLDKLAESLKFVGGKKGFEDISDAAGKFDTSHMASALDNISSKFSAMGVIGFTVIQHLTESVLSFAKETADKVIGPIMEGGKRRAENIEQAQFQFRGLGIDVTKAMDSALAAVKGTAYGLDEAAKVAAQFGASGIQAGDQMTRALRGIAGAAAMTGTSFSEMGAIFTSSAGSGVVNNMDLQQFATRGLNAAAAVGKVMGKTEAQIHEMARNGDLDFKTFADAMDKAFGAHATQANETYSGSIANMHAALSRLGATFFTPNLMQQRDLFNALTPVIDNVTAALKPLIGVFSEMGRVSTAGIVKSLGAIDLTNFTAGIKLIAEGVGNLFVVFVRLKSIATDAFHEIFPPSATSTFVSISQAFKDFTERLKMGGETAEKFKSIFAGFFAVISIGWEIIKQLAGILGELLGSFTGVGGGLLDFSAGVGNSLVALQQALVTGGGIKDFFAAIPTFIGKAIDFVKNFKDNVTGLFDDFVGLPSISDATGRLTSRMDALGGSAAKVSGFFQHLWDSLQGVRDVFDKVWDVISTWFKELGGKIAAVLKPGDFNSAVDVLNVGLLGGIAVLLKNFVDNGLKLNFAPVDKIMEKIKGSLDALTGALKSMQTNIKATALLKIAGAVGILTVSIVALSLINSEALTKALVAISASFGMLLGTMALMDKMGISNGGAAKMNALGSSMILFATAMDILAVAIKALSGLSVAELAKGIGGVAAAMAIMVGSMQLMTTDVSGLIRAGIAMGAMAGAMTLMAAAVKLFSTMSLGELAKGLGAVAVTLGTLVLAMSVMPTGSLLAAGLAMIPLATGLTILAGAVALFAAMSWESMAQGLIGIGGALVIIAGAMHLMPLDIPITAAGLVILAGAMNLMAVAILAMGSMNFGTLAKGIGGLAVVLGILVIAMNGMDSALAGAASLVIVSGALVILAGVLKTLGSMSLGELAIGLGAIAAVLVILGGAALLLTPVIPEMFALGAALALIGGSFALFGFGASMVANSFQAMAAAGEAGTKALIASITALIDALPKILTHFTKSLGEMAAQLVASADLIIRVFSAILLDILDTIIRNTPKIGEALGAILSTGLKLIREHFPDLLRTGLEIVLTLLQGIGDNIGQLVTAAVSLITNFVDALIQNMPLLVGAAVALIAAFVQNLASHAVELVAAGANLIIAVIEGISQKVGDVIQAIADLIINILAQLADGMTRIIDAGANILTWLIQGISDNITKVSDKVTELIVKFIQTLDDNTQKILAAGTKMLTDLLQGISDNITKVADKVGEIVAKFIGTLGSNAQKIADAGANTLVSFLNGLGRDIQKVIDAGGNLIIKIIQGLGTKALEITNATGQAILDFLNGFDAAVVKYEPQIIAKGFEIGKHIITGMIKGLTDSKLISGVVDAAVNVAKSAWEAAKNFLHIGSPSRLFAEMGGFMVKGMAIGLEEDDSATNSAVVAAEKIVSAFYTTLQKAADPVLGLDIQPVITPVLDLSNVRAGASELDKMLAGSVIAPEVSTSQARQISTTTELANQDAPTTVETAPTEVTFNQYNTSPEALSTADIYRNTNSQIAKMKEELEI